MTVPRFPCNGTIILEITCRIWFCWCAFTDTTILKIIPSIKSLIWCLYLDSLVTAPLFVRLLAGSEFVDVYLQRHHDSHFLTWCQYLSSFTKTKFLRSLHQKERPESSKCMFKYLWRRSHLLHDLVIVWESVQGPDIPSDVQQCWSSVVDCVIVKINQVD